MRVLMSLADHISIPVECSKAVSKVFSDAFGVEHGTLALAIGNWQFGVFDHEHMRCSKQLVRLKSWSLMRWHIITQDVPRNAKLPSFGTYRTDHVDLFKQNVGGCGPLVDVFRR
ncbi:hypothetical protein PMIN06_010062 [Paraphaeosphaeria minitans]